MSTISKIAMMSAAGAGGAGLDITDVFSTYLYEGTGTTQTITNGIDLDGEGGLVWGKSRSATQNHRLYDTEGNGLYSNLTNGSFGSSGRFTSNSDGFNLTASSGITGQTGFGGPDYVSWTFRKAPKFFDVVTWTGDATNGRVIPHNLGTTVGSIIIKSTTSSANWIVHHRSVGTSQALNLNNTGASFSFTGISDVTSTSFTVSSNASLNDLNQTFIAYVFAHNDGDGEFGPDGDQDIIKCGSFGGSGGVQEVNLGFEPQFVLMKTYSGSDGGSRGNNWIITDSMRGTSTSLYASDGKALWANSSAAEGADQYINLTATGFRWVNSSEAPSYSYIAIRRGPLAVPEVATEVFAPAITYDEINDPGFNSGFVTDMLLWRQPQINDETRFFTRLNQGKRLVFNSSVMESNDTGQPFDFNDGVDAPTNDNARGWMWRRAPHFCDVVCYTGTGSTQNITHNLGVAPEMMWVKRRNNTDMWKAYHLGTGNTKYTRMDGVTDGIAASVTSSTTWNNTTPSDTTFTVGTASDVNGSGSTYIATLFTSLDGVSKVGSYTGNGSSQTIDCGFTSGARFILIKRTNASGDWYVWDTVRGIVTGNDPYLTLNGATAQVTTNDSIDPASSGFIVNQVSANNINVSSAEYIFYAVA